MTNLARYLQWYNSGTVILRVINSDLIELKAYLIEGNSCLILET